MLKTVKGDAFDAAPAADATINQKLPTRRPILLDAVTLVPTGYTGSTNELDLATAIREVRLVQDGQVKARIKPSLQRLLDDFLNANADTLDISKMLIPFNRYLNPGSGWGVGNINELLLQVEFGPAVANQTVSALVGYWHFHEIDTPKDRGRIFVQTYLPQSAPNASAGGTWNEITDIPFYGITNITKMLLNHRSITEVKISLDTEVVYHKTKEEALFELRVNPLYKVPSTCTHTRIQGQTVTSTGPFPIVLDAFGQTGDSMYILDRNGNRRRVKIEYLVDSNVAVSSAFDVLVEGLEEDNNRQVIPVKA